MAELEVLTINLRHEDERDGSNDWPRRKPHTVRFIQETAPQIFGTQEGRRPQILDLLHGLTGYALSDAHRQWDPKRFYPCIFFRPEVVQVVESGDRWLSETPEVHASKSWGSAFPRLATWARMRLIGEGGELIFVSTHLDNISAEARQGQAGKLLELLDTVNPRGLPEVLVGDFNDHPGSVVHRILTRRLRDAWSAAHPDGREADTWHGFSGEGQRGRLDWVMVSPQVTVLDVQVMETSYNGSYPSDHFPVRARLEW